MHDSLLGIAKRVNSNAKFFCIVAQGLNLSAAGWVCDWLIDVPGWCVVVFGSNCEIGATNWAPGKAKTIKSLWAGYLVH